MQCSLTVFPPQKPVNRQSEWMSLNKVNLLYMSWKEVDSPLEIVGTGNAMAEMLSRKKSSACKNNMNDVFKCKC